MTKSSIGIKNVRIIDPYNNMDNVLDILIENGKIKRSESLSFIYLVAVVIKNGMNILGVSLPEKM